MPVETDTSEPPSMYYLTLDVRGGSIRTVTTVNGLWIHTTEGSGNHNFSSPVNDLLVGRNNAVNVRITAKEVEDEKSGTESSPVPSDVMVEVSVKKITGGTVAPESGDVLAEQSLEQVIEERKRELKQKINEKLQNASSSERRNLEDQEEERTTVKFPLQIKLTFDSEDVPSFRHRFLEAPKIEDASLVKDYAMELKKLLRNRNLDALYREFEKKFEEYDRAYPSQSEPDNRRWFKEKIREAFYLRDTFLDFDRDDLKLKKWCNGRIWELEVARDPKMDNSFLYARDDEGAFFMDVFVGMVDGELNVVR